MSLATAAVTSLVNGVVVCVRAMARSVPEILQYVEVAKLGPALSATEQRVAERRVSR